MRRASGVPDLQVLGPPKRHFEDVEGPRACKSRLSLTNGIPIPDTIYQNVIQNLVKIVLLLLLPEVPVLACRVHTRLNSDI